MAVRMLAIKPVWFSSLRNVGYLSHIVLKLAVTVFTGLQFRTL